MAGVPLVVGGVTYTHTSLDQLLQNRFHCFPVTCAFFDGAYGRPHPTSRGHQVKRAHLRDALV